MARCADGMPHERNRPAGQSFISHAHSWSAKVVTAGASILQPSAGTNVTGISVPASGATDASSTGAAKSLSGSNEPVSSHFGISGNRQKSTHSGRSSF